ncbi:methyltransferase domain-containing protein [Aestuariispira ectoiniformans]|uniref:methyltransferase domain-containing protein n=1 Tax=Aestuariispira ectoiniformans TaxID=2775080 RepID=UPI00223C3A54|nr:methyltransferase domain-containing protein [Aestuariispira ectoiniformans]
MAWDPRQYLNFADHRLRPAVDLITRIPVSEPTEIVDLGCGPGNVTQLLANRWPEATITGVDSSRKMLQHACTEHPGFGWQVADIGDWTAQKPVGLLFSNAALHWLPDHETLFPRLIEQVSPGGIMAIQMPRNFDRPTHRLVEDAARETGVFDRLASLFRPAPTHPPDFYYDLLSPYAAGLDIWETDYLQVLEGNNPVMEWTRGTWLRQFLEVLEDDPTAQQRFLDCYRDLTAQAYPKQQNGKTLLPFLRLFILVRRK